MKVYNKTSNPLEEHAFCFHLLKKYIFIPNYTIPSFLTLIIIGYLSTNSILWSNYLFITNYHWPECLGSGLRWPITSSGPTIFFSTNYNWPECWGSGLRWPIASSGPTIFLTLIIIGQNAGEAG
jgi:hypothetical protein